MTKPSQCTNPMYLFSKCWSDLDQMSPWMRFNLVSIQHFQSKYYLWFGYIAYHSIKSAQRFDVLVENTECHMLSCSIYCLVNELKSTSSSTRCTGITHTHNILNNMLNNMLLYAIMYWNSSRIFCHFMGMSQLFWRSSFPEWQCIVGFVWIACKSQDVYIFCNMIQS